jgi:hypothetical protein
MNVPPTDDEIASDTVIDAIALIESQRQDLGREPDPAAWRKRALGVLEDLLGRIEEATRLHGQSAERHANAEAVRMAIRRVKAGANVARPHPTGEAARRRRSQSSQQPKGGRRPIGRSGRR